MGAYENPQGYIDTQTGQYYRELQSTIAGAVAGIAQQYKARQEEINKINLKVGEEESAMYRTLADTQQTNPTVNFEELYRPKIKEYAALRTSILNGTSKDPSADRMKADAIFASVSNIKDSLIDLSSEGFLDKYAKMGGPNGYAIGENDPKVINGMLIFANKLPGVKKGRFVDGDSNKFVWDIYDKDGSLVQTLSAEQLKKTANGSGLLKTIPDAASTVDNIKSTTTNIFETKDNIATGFIKKEYLIADQPFDKEIPGKKTTVVNGVEYDQKQYTPSYKIDKEKIAADPNFNAVVKAKAEGYANGSESGMDAIIFNNTYFKNMEGFQLLDADKPMSLEDKTKFIENFKKYTLDGIPSDQPIPGANTTTVTEKAGRQPAAARPPKPTKEPKKSATEVLNESIFETTPEQRNKKGVGQGTIVKGPNKKFKIADKNDGGKAGYWYEIDKDGFIIGQPLSETYVKAQIGYKPKLVKK
jgi:hypothetical protein